MTDFPSDLKIQSGDCLVADTVSTLRRGLAKRLTPRLESKQMPRTATAKVSLASDSEKLDGSNVRPVSTSDFPLQPVKITTTVNTMSTTTALKGLRLPVLGFILGCLLRSLLPALLAPVMSPRWYFGRYLGSSGESIGVFQATEKDRLGGRSLVAGDTPLVLGPSLP